MFNRRAYFMRTRTLLVVDYIKGIASGAGSCAQYVQNHPEVITNTNALIVTARDQKTPIFHVRLAFDPDYLGLPKYAPSARAICENSLFHLGAESTEFISDINMLPDDVIINKAYGDVFHGNELLKKLKGAGVEEIIFTGVSTDNAILNSANTAMVNNFYVTVVADACGAPTDTAHEHALDMMRGRTASEITTTCGLLEKLSLR
jgi:nicotinamidase-related amidase